MVSLGGLLYIPFMDGTPRSFRGKLSFRGGREEERAKRWSNLRGDCSRCKGVVSGTGGTRDNVTFIGRPQTCSIDDENKEVRQQTTTTTMERDPCVPTCLKISKLDPPPQRRNGGRLLSFFEFSAKAPGCAFHKGDI